MSLQAHPALVDDLHVSKQEELMYAAANKRSKKKFGSVRTNVTHGSSVDIWSSVDVWPRKINASWCNCVEPRWTAQPNCTSLYRSFLTHSLRYNRCQSCSFIMFPYLSSWPYYSKLSIITFVYARTFVCLLFCVFSINDHLELFHEIHRMLPTCASLSP